MGNSGIYQIRNTRNGKIYIGSTNNFDRRKSEHFSDLKLNRHASPYLQHAYNKEIENQVFIFEVILVCEESHLILFEQQFLDFYKPQYNLVLTAGRTILSPESMQKRINSLRKTLAQPIHQERMRNQVLGDKNPAKRLDVRRKMSEAIRKSVLARGESHHMKQPKHRERMKIDNPGMRPAHRQRMRENNPSARRVIELESGQIFNTMTEAANYYKVDLSHMVDVCKGKSKTVKGHRFAYAESNVA